MSDLIEIKTTDVFGSVLPPAAKIQALTATIGKSHYLVLGSPGSHYVLFEKIPAPLAIVGVIADVSLSSLRVFHKKDEEVDCCYLVTVEDGDNAIPTPLEEGKAKNSLVVTPKRLSQALRGKNLPFTKQEDAKPIAGISGEEELTIIYDDEVSYSLGDDDDAIRHVLGRGTKLCRFPMLVSDFRLINRADVTRLTISTEDSKMPLLCFHCEDFGMFRLVSGLENLRPQSVKDSLESLRADFGIFEEIAKEAFLGVKSTLAGLESGIRDFKRKLTEGAKLTAKLSTEQQADPRKVKQLEDSIALLDSKLNESREDAKAAKGDLVKFEKIRAAMKGL